jgi:hypothetical protein
LRERKQRPDKLQREGRRRERYAKVMADTEPLISTEGSPAPEDENFLPDVIFFLGKELRTGMGMRQSFIRKPGTEQVLVRIGIGRDGVFKVDGMENKVGQTDDPFVDG